MGFVCKLVYHWPTHPYNADASGPLESSLSIGIKTLKDFLAGSLAGFCGKLVEYPFDTVKVLQQTEIKPQPALVIFQQVFKAQGFTGLYRGLASPLVGSMAENAVLFSGFSTGKRLLCDPSNPDALLPKMLAGAMAGVAVATVLTPVELVKVKMQFELQQMNANKAFKPQYRSTLDCIRQTIAREGVVRGLFKGHVATLAREMPGNAAWFGTYEFLCTKMIPAGGRREDLQGWQNMVAGAASGMAYWSAFYPADTVKSQMQSAPEGAPKHSFVWWFKHVYHQNGLKGMYRGWGITVARAAPSNAVLFFIYELTSKHMK